MEQIHEQDLELQAVIGFQGKWLALINNITGKVIDGLILHPDNEHIIYPLGTTLVVRHIISRTQQFLRVSVLAVTSGNTFHRGLTSFRVTITTSQ